MVNSVNFNSTLRRIELSPKITKGLNFLQKETLKLLKDILENKFEVDYFHVTENVIKRYIEDNTSYQYEINLGSNFIQPEVMYKLFNSLYEAMDSKWNKRDIRVIGKRIDTDTALYYIQLVSEDIIFKFGVYSGTIYDDIDECQLRLQYLVTYGHGDEIYDSIVVNKIIELLGNKVEDITCKKDCIILSNLYSGTNYRTLKLLLTKKLINFTKKSMKLNRKLDFNVILEKNNIVITFT